MVVRYRLPDFLFLPTPLDKSGVNELYVKGESGTRMQIFRRPKFTLAETDYLRCFAIYSQFINTFSCVLKLFLFVTVTML